MSASRTFFGTLPEKRERGEGGREGEGERDEQAGKGEGG